MTRQFHAALLALAATSATAQGDAQRGAAIVFDSERGNCTICHVIAGLSLPEDAQGNIGPPLAGISAWRSAEELAAIITDPRALMPGTVMPAYGTTDGLNDVAPQWRGRPVLTGDDIADVVAYLMELR